MQRLCELPFHMVCDVKGSFGVQAVTALKKLNVPYLVSLPLVFQTTEEWLDSELGVHPVQVALQVQSQQGMKTPFTPLDFRVGQPWYSQDTAESVSTGSHLAPFLES